MGKTIIRRIDRAIDSEILRVQADLIKEQGKVVSYPEASRFYAEMSFNSKTNVKEALRKLGSHKFI